MRNSAIRKKFNYCFSGDFYEYWFYHSSFNFGRRTEHYAIILESFQVFLMFTIFLRSLVLSRLVTSKTIHMYEFITSNYSSFHLWWKKNLLNYQKVSKYYEHDCLQNFILLFMSLLTVLIVKNAHILAWSWLFQKKCYRSNLKGFQYQI